MPSNTRHSGARIKEHPQHGEPLVYRLGSSPSTWPSLVVNSPAKTVEMYDGFGFGRYSSGSHYYLVFNHSLAATLAEYGNLPIEDRRREFVLAVGVDEDAFRTHENLKEVENRLPAGLSVAWSTREYSNSPVQTMKRSGRVTINSTPRLNCLMGLRRSLESCSSKS